MVKMESEQNVVAPQRTAFSLADQRNMFCIRRDIIELGFFKKLALDGSKSDLMKSSAKVDQACLKGFSLDQHLICIT
jgi:hypothetical protein